MKFVLTGGEDHALVGTFEPADVPEGWTVIGSAAEGNQERQAGTGPGRRAVCRRVRSRPGVEMLAQRPTIAGSDLGRAGIQADLKTMLAEWRARDECADRDHGAEQFPCPGCVGAAEQVRAQFRSAGGRHRCRRGEDRHVRRSRWSAWPRRCCARRRRPCRSWSTRCRCSATRCAVRRRRDGRRTLRDRPAGHRPPGRRNADLEAVEDRAYGQGPAGRGAVVLVKGVSPTSVRPSVDVLHGPGACHVQRGLGRTTGTRMHRMHAGQRNSARAVPGPGVRRTEWWCCEGVRDRGDRGRVRNSRWWIGPVDHAW